MAQEEDSNRSIQTRTESRADGIQDNDEQPSSKVNENQTGQSKQLFWTRVATGLVFIYTVVMGLQLKTQRDTFNATNRPYVGSKMAVGFAWTDANGVFQTSMKSTREATMMDINALFQNYGPVPGTNFKGSWRVFLDGVEQPTINKAADLPSTIYPTQTKLLPAQIGPPVYKDITTGSKTLIIDVTVNYDGPNGHYTECEREQYAPELGNFFDLGPRCSQ